MIFYPQPFPQERLIMQAQETQQAAAGSWGAYVDENGVAWWLHNGAKPWANQVYDVSPNTVPQLQLPPQYQQSPTPLQPPRMICPTTAPSVTWAMPSPATFQPTIPSAWIGGGVPVPCYVPVVIRTSDKKKDKKKQRKRSPSWAWESRWDDEKKRRCWKNSVSKRVFYEDPESDCDNE